MKVFLKRTGGAGGITRQWKIDLESLPPEKSRELKTLLEDVNGAESKSAAASQCRDHFCYELMIEDPGKKKTLRYSEENLPPPLRHCVDWILNPQGRLGK